MPTISQVIRKYRIESGMAQAVLGKKIGVNVAPQKRVSEWENGVRTPTAEYLLKIMAALHIPPEAFDEYKVVHDK